MKNKLLAVIFLFVVLLAGLIGCGNSNENQNGTQTTGSETTASSANQTELQSSKTSVPAPAVPFEPVSGKLVDAGNIRAICPEGWYSLPVTDYFSDEKDALDKNKLFFQKFSDDEWSNLPNVVISFYGEATIDMPYEEQLDYYSEDAECLAPFMIGDAVWEGLIYPVGENVIEAVISPQENGEFDVGVRLEGDGEVITFVDADLQTILTSIAY